ncbi:MAG: plasmid maintenance protein CcdB [Methylomonas sp.]|nr:MAG: plasmid maintenance protein CcdB [Methylomonas sp.]PPD26823.1 MAG: plasmid maintenance protein CcdB [Methylomonas sp.]PPD38687.1 MAG: plasmid maintenance protein CcdB [Methylomonas sp.]PPD40820.1 MAG: plasmid maintenance protein CcdB [Methylomonas sp.]PPD52923.1 MAG: plasmid maintenance protein CcdB [Methylomonas sp.]
MQDRYPFLLDIQSDFLDELKTLLLIPAIKLAEQKPITRLNPVFEFEQQHYLLVAQEIAAIPPNSLGTKVSDLESLRGKILAAVDLLITGIKWAVLE